MSDFSVKPTLTSDLVTLRPFQEGDADALFGALHDHDSMRLTGTHAEFTEAQVRQFYGTRNEQTDRLDLAVEDPSTGECVGEAVLNEWDPDNHSCSFRIMLLASGRDRGLGTDATRLIVGYGFEQLDLHRISLEVYDFNPRGRRAYEKVGFVVEGTLRDALLWDGEWVDATLMSILAPDWALSSGLPMNPPGRAGHDDVSSAEGATTPESLRQLDRTGEATLESSTTKELDTARRPGSPKGKDRTGRTGGLPAEALRYR